uniref:NADH-ubiquinone oxidoreductase chain 2 n=1 Tax=Oncopodura yosiiana TaxID=2581075 RepID=A0A6H0EY08_9HEXA|nr:NADH dehydrogenase subunit 2 [Oncopodura yosiiana]QIT06419.1 NADH dehydrogenase subunit 2 [Oncopodura yosiiana]
MLMKTSTMLFLIMMMLGTIMAISSSSWITTWIGLEINLMSIIPILINKKSYKSTEASVKYFLIQAMASIFIIFLSLMFNKNFNFNLNSNLEMTLFVIPLMMKAGVAPLHFWFPQVMNCIDWFQGLIMLTWQKIAPLILSSYILSPIISLMILSSALVGSLGGFNQNKIKIILTYSSILHSGWMLMLIFIDLTNWMNYFFIYTFISVIIFFYLKNMSTLNFNNIYSVKNKQNTNTIFMFNFLSLAGLPPFLGFSAKIMAIQNILLKMNFSTTILMFLIFNSLISLFYYLKISYSTFMKSFMLNKILNIKNKNLKNKMNMIFMMSILGNIFIPILMFLI